MKKEEIFKNNIENQKKTHNEYLFSLGSVIISTVTFIITSFFLISAITYKAPVVYIWADENKRIMDNTPLNEMHI
jgi:hypothetical protein